MAGNAIVFWFSVSHGDTESVNMKEGDGELQSLNSPYIEEKGDPRRTICKLINFYISSRLLAMPTIFK